MTDEPLPLSELTDEGLIERYQNLWRFYQSEESRDKGYDFAKCREIMGKVTDARAMLEHRGYRVQGVSVEPR